MIVTDTDVLISFNAHCFQNLHLLATLLYVLQNPLTDHRLGTTDLDTHNRTVPDTSLDRVLAESQ